MYGYVEAAFGPMAGFIGGVLLWLGCVLAAGGIAAALGEALARVVPGVPAVVARDGVIVVVLAGVALLNSRGVKTASRVIGLATALKLLPLLLFVGLGALFVHPSNLHAGGVADPSGLGRAVILAMFAFQGMETPLSASGEVANPSRNLPLALFIAMLAVTGLYVAIQVVSQGLLGANLAGAGNHALESAFSTINPGLGLVMIAAAAISRTVWLGSDSLGAPRILFAFARDGMLPGPLGKVSERGRAPVNAIWTHAAIAIVLALTGTFEQLTVLSVLADVALYIMACAAAWKLRREGVALMGKPLALPALTLWVVLAIASQIAVILLAKPIEIAALVGTVVALCVIYAVMRLFRRKA
jgi:amino acid transporter